MKFSARLVAVLQSHNKSNGVNKMKHIELDFSNYHSIEELHEALKSAFRFPDYYGANLDALWDCMRDLDGIDSIIVSVKGISDWLNQAYYGDYANRLLGIFEDVHKECPEITFEIVS